MTRLTIVVPGNPKPQQRPRSRAMKLSDGRWVSQVYNPHGETADYRARVAHEAAIVADHIMSGPLKIELQFTIQKPKSKPKKVIWPAVRPDWDNYAKACVDALTGIVFKDDAQICWASVVKIYGGKPQTEIRIESLNHDTIVSKGD